MAATILALIAGLFNAGNDLVYRRISLSGRDIRFPFYFLSTITSFMVTAAATMIIFHTMRADKITLLFGTAMGVLSFVTYFLFLHSFSGTNTPVSITIYRMNMIPGIILAALFLGEAVTLRRTIGICLCAASVVLFSEKVHASRRETRYILLALGSCISGGILNFINRMAMMHGATALPLLFWRFLTASALAGIVLAGHPAPRLDRREIGYSAIAGFCLAAAILFLLEGFRIAEVSRILPTSHVFSIALATLVTRIFFSEKITPARAAGLLAAAGAIVLVN